MGDSDVDRAAEIELRLRMRYGQPRHENPADPLDDLVLIVLSRMTQEVKYVRTYRALREELPTWDAVREAPKDELEEILADAGLAPTKAQQIQEILEEIERREGALDLGRLHDLSDEEAEAYLTSLPGVATKSARCVMLYALERDTFPVDTHVWRVCQRLGIAPREPWSDRRGRALQDEIPGGLRASLHVTMVSHGREVCVAGTPRCGDCDLADLCPFFAEQPT